MACYIGIVRPLTVCVIAVSVFDAAVRVFDAIYFDTLGRWGKYLNYRREHCAYADYPLTFDIVAVERDSVG